MLMTLLGLKGIKNGLCHLIIIVYLKILWWSQDLLTEFFKLSFNVLLDMQTIFCSKKKVY